MTNWLIVPLATMAVLLFANMGFSGTAFGQGEDSPKKQLEMGVEPEDIVCKARYVLVILQSDSSYLIKAGPTWLH